MGQNLGCECASRSGQSASGEELKDPVQDLESVQAEIVSLRSDAKAAIVKEVNSKYVHSLGTVRTSHPEGDENTDDDYMELATVDWMDWFMRQLWPHFEKMMQKIVRTKIEPEIDKELDKYGVAGRAFKGVKFTRCEIGDKRPVLGPVRSYRKSHQDFFGIEIDCDIRLDCAPCIEMTIGGMTVGVKRLKFEGTVSVIMKPFVDDAPVVGGAQMFLMNRPTLDFQLGGALNAINSSIIHSVLKKIALDQITQSFVLPQRVHLNILKEWQLKTDMVSLLSPVPEGIVRVRVVSASNLPASDIHLQDIKDITSWMSGHRGTLGTVSDPFCEVQIGSGTFRTETVERTVNPIWTSGCTGDFLVYNLAQDVLVRVFDNDFGLTKNDVLGSASLTVGTLIRSENITIPLNTERDETSKADNDVDGMGRQGGEKISIDKSPQRPQVCLRAEYFVLGEPRGVDDFTRFRTQHDGPSEALLGVKIFGLRSIGHKSTAGDVVGKTLRVTLHGHDGSTTSFSSKPTRLRGSHIEVDGIEPNTLRIVRNLHALNPDMPLEAIASAAELDPSTVRSILQMSDLFPVQVNAGFFFCVHSHRDDICLVELLPTKKAETRKAICSFKIPVSQIAAEQGMILKKCFMVRRGQLDRVRKPEREQNKTAPTSFFKRSHSVTFAGLTSSMGISRRWSAAKVDEGDAEVNHSPTADEQRGHGNDHSDQQSNSSKPDGMQCGDRDCDFTDEQIEISMELQLYSMASSRRTSDP